MIQEISRHINFDFTEPIRDPIWKNIYFPKPLLMMINSPSFQKLSKIKQLGPTYHVYPGATHTRLNHSLGVFHLAKRIIQSILIFDELEFITLEGLKAFLCAALFHDLGHFPYTHSLKELPLKSHEVLTGEIILNSELHHMIEHNYGTDPYFVAAIADLTIPSQGNPEIEFYRNLLSGSLDPDKLDYLNRDAYFCGVPYGIQDIDYIISKLRPFNNNTLAVDESGISSLESVLFSKYLMYKNVYWHKTVRIATTMIKKGLHYALTQELLKPQELYGLDDESFITMAEHKNHPIFQLILDVSKRKLYKCVYEIPFSETADHHHKLEDLTYRTGKENALYDALRNHTSKNYQPYHIIIDLPEAFSFEKDFKVMHKERAVSFMESNAVFTSAVIENFTKVIRKIRVIVSPELAETLQTKNIPWDQLLQ